MNKEEIKHFKAMLRQGLLRHMNIILDDKFQSELLNIIKDYEKQQQENKQLKDNWNKLKKELKEIDKVQREWNDIPNTRMTPYDAILETMQELERGKDEKGRNI